MVDKLQIGLQKRQGHSATKYFKILNHANSLTANNNIMSVVLEMEMADVKSLITNITFSK